MLKEEIRFWKLKTEISDISLWKYSQKGVLFPNSAHHFPKAKMGESVSHASH